MDGSFIFLQDLAVILISAAIGGLLFRRLGLSAVPGYILAGLVVGTPEIVFPYVSDEERISIIAQLGVVFLMFSVGLQFSLQRVRQLGVRVLISTALLAVLVMSAVRLSADALGLTAAAGIALAAVFMNSSSAIISKLIHDSGCGHERHAQLAMGTTLLEDIVAVVMLAILGSYIAIDGSGSGRSPVAVIGMVAGFALLVYITGTLLLPSLFRLRGIANNPEAMSVVAGGLALGSALVAVYAGFSLALGSFLCGMVVSGTAQKQSVERSFQGLKDIFLTVFFVTIGMMVDISLFPALWPWILAGIAGALIGRSLAAWAALIVIGEHPRTALQTALLLTPLGEFSFIIAGIAIAGGLLPSQFQVVVVGTVLGTSLISPIFGIYSERLTRFVAQGRWPAVDNLHRSYNQFWTITRRGKKKTSLWTFLRKRLLQIAREVLLISTILIFANDLISAVAGWMPEAVPAPTAVLLLWIGVGLFTLIPLIAMWRNLDACALILAESFAMERRLHRTYQLQIERGLRILFAVLTVVWLLNVLPSELPRTHILGVAILLFFPAVALLWRKAVRLHSEFESTLQQRLAGSSQIDHRDLFDNWKEEAWDLNLREFELPDGSACAGKTLRQINLRGSTSCAIVGIQRHGFAIAEISPGTSLFPGDELLLLGSNSQIDAAVQLLATDEAASSNIPPLRERILKSVGVTTASRAVGLTLEELDWSKRFNVQILAIQRNQQTLTGPARSMRIELDDRLLLLGTDQSIHALAESELWAS